MPMSDAVLSEDPKTTGIQQMSLALSLTHRDFSSFSESFDDVMLMRFAKPLQFDIEEHCFQSIPQSFYALFHRLESLCPSLFLRENLPL